jgi:two-component system chemotaxis response regulator CheB
MLAGSKKRVLIVDDSAIVRKMLRDALASDPDIDVVGGAADAFVAREMILLHQPDLVTLDIEMPRMDGLTFLRQLMEHHPIPVIIVSSVTQSGSRVSVEALAAGAVDVIA